MVRVQEEGHHIVVPLFANELVPAPGIAELFVFVIW